MSSSDTIAIVTAIIALAAAVAAWQQVRTTRQEMERRDRPYIFGQFEDVGQGLVVFVLENKGTTAANNVHAWFEEPAPTLRNGSSLNTASTFKNIIAFFPPGARYLTPIGNGFDLLAGGKPKQFKLNLSYKTLSGREVVDLIEFDLAYLANVLATPASTAVVLGKLKEPLDKISRVMEWWRNEQWSARAMEEMGLGGEEGDEGNDG